MNIEEELNSIQRHIEKWNSLIRDVKLPIELAPAMMAGRGELVSLAKARDLKASEVKVLYDLIGCLLETNQALQHHSALVSELAVQTRGHIKGFLKSMEKLESYAGFRTPRNEDDED